MLVLRSPYGQRIDARVATMLGLVLRGLGLEGCGLGRGGCDFVNITVGFFRQIWCTRHPGMAVTSAAESPTDNEVT